MTSCVCRTRNLGLIGQQWEDGQAGWLRSILGPDNMVRQAGRRIQVQGLESRPGNQEACRLGREGGKGQEQRAKPVAEIQAAPPRWKKGTVVTVKGLLLGQGCPSLGFPRAAPPK